METQTIKKWDGEKIVETQIDGKTSNNFELLKLEIAKVVSDPQEYCNVITILEEAQ